MAFDTNGERIRPDEAKRRLSRSGKSKAMRRQDCADDEDYIVFCFREDGDFDIVKNGKISIDEMPDCSLDRTSRSTRAVNRKVSDKKLNFCDRWLRSKN